MAPNPKNRRFPAGPKTMPKTEVHNPAYLLVSAAAVEATCPKLSEPKAAVEATGPKLSEPKAQPVLARLIPTTLTAKIGPSLFGLGTGDSNIYFTFSWFLAGFRPKLGPGTCPTAPA